MIELVVASVLAVLAFGYARGFVRRRLRFVDQVRSPLAPVAAGVGAALIALPVVGILPILGGFTAALLGVGAGLGTASGVKALKSGD